MSHARWARRHVRFLVFLTAVLAAAGGAAVWWLPVSLFPHVSFPRVQVSIEAGDQPAERMAVDVTTPVEESLRSVPGVQRVRSTTSRGSAEISVDFAWGADMLAAMMQVEAQVNRGLATLPPGATSDVRRMDPTVFPTLAFSLTSTSSAQTELRDLAAYELRPALATVKGVARVGIQGGAVEEYHVIVDPARLSAYGMTVDDVAKGLSAANVLKAVGRVEDHYKLELVVADGRITDAAGIAAAVLRSAADGVVKVSDVATVREAAQPQFMRVTADGRDAVLLQVFQQPDGNTVQISADCQARLEEIKRRLPPGVRIATWYDQSELILSSAKSVGEATLVGVALAGLTLLLFLRNWRATLIATAAVPVVLAVTVLALHLLGMSFNVMTLGGMAAAVGLIIDDAIVVVEHIVRRTRDEIPDTGSVAREGLNGELNSGEAGVLDAADEFTRPLAGSSASTIVIHAPPAFLVGVAGAFFAALSLTMAASLCISFAVAWLLIPALAGRFLRQPSSGLEAPHRARNSLVARAYAAVASPLVRWPWAVTLLIAPLCLGGYLAFNVLPTGFMPVMDEGGFILDYVAPPGTSTTETDRLLRIVESILRSTPEVDTYSRRTGLQLGGGITESNSGDFFIRLKPFPRRDIEAVMAEVRHHVEARVPGLEIETPQLMEDVIGDLTAVPQPVEVKLFADDRAVLLDAGPVVAKAIEGIDGLVEVKSGVVPAGDSLTIEIDPVKLAAEGCKPEDVASQLTDLVSGRVATSIQRGPKTIGVRAWVPAGIRNDDSKIEALPVRATDGHVFPLSRIANVRVVAGEPEVTHEDLRRMVAVTGRIEGRDLGSVVRDVRAALDRPGLLPPGVSYRLGGIYQEQQTAFRGLLAVIVAAAALVFLVLLFLYERVRIAAAILTVAALALAAVLVGLWVTGTQLNITSVMGMVMIVGNVTEVSVFYCSELTSLSPELPVQARLVSAGLNRLRAIAITTMAAILALLPLALGFGHGSAMLQPLANAIIIGLIVQGPLVLLILPALLSLSRVVEASVVRQTLATKVLGDGSLSRSLS